MGNVPIPIGSTEHRLPQAGRIRLGVKDKSRQGRSAIPHFRFTSTDERLLAPVAATYGGEVRPWKDAKSGDRFELLTKANRLDVILAPNPMTESYELWSGERGLERRCDGVTCQMLVGTPDGGEFQPVDCPCYAAGKVKCKYKLRINVMLPEVQSIGTWRLDTSSENARKEIPGVVQLIESIGGVGVYRAVLRVEQRTAPGKRFNVPVLDLQHSVESLLAGQARLDSLPATPPSASAGELAAGESGSEPVPHRSDSGSPTNDIEDAVVVTDHVTGPHPIDPNIGQAFLESLTTSQKTRALIRARELALELGEPVPMDVDSISSLIADHLCKEWR